MDLTQALTKMRKEMLFVISPGEKWIWGTQHQLILHTSVWDIVEQCHVTCRSWRERKKSNVYDDSIIKLYEYGIFM